MKISNETKIGVLAVVAIALLIVGYQYLQGKRVFSDEDVYHADYHRVSGLSESDDVLFRGLKVGSVRAIELAPELDRITVSFTIDEPIQIPAGSEARIVNADLLGAKALELILTDSSQFVSPGNALRGTVEQSLSQQIEEQLQPVTNKISVLLGSIDSVITRINGIFDVRLQGKIDENIISIEAAIRNIRDITAGVNQIVTGSVETIDTIMVNLAATTSTINDNKEQLDSTFKNLKLITDDLAKANISNALASFDSTVTTLNEVARKINEGEGSFAQLINDSNLYEQLEKSSKNLNLLLEEIRKKPGAYAPALIRIGVK